jgi:hypothetical protein
MLKEEKRSKWEKRGKKGQVVFETKLVGEGS